MASSTPYTRQAFTLIEVMIAAAIFAIGLIAVAAIFPTAIQLQKQTFEEIRGDEFSKTVRSLILQRGFDERLLAERADDDNSTATVDDDPVPRVTIGSAPNQTTLEPPTVFSAPLVVSGQATAPEPANLGSAAGWSMTDRSSGSLENAIYTDGAGDLAGFPPNIANPTGNSNTYEYGGRNLFWTPLFIDYNQNVANATKPATLPGSDPRANRNWGAFIFVLRGDPKSNYLRPTDGAVIDYALDIDIDVPQDKNLDTPPGQVGNDPYIKVPGVVRLELDPNSLPVSGNRFEFDNRVGDLADPDNPDAPIVRVGDTILAENGVTYVVSGLLEGNPSTGVEVDGFIVNRPNNQNPVSEIWAAHPGDSGESSLVRVILLVNDDETNNLIR